MTTTFARKLKIFVPVAVLLFGLWLLPSCVFAQTDGSRGITISPFSFELTSDPGDTITNEIKVFNPTDSTFSVRMEVEDFTAVGDLGVVRVEPSEAGTYSLKQWTSFDPVTFSMGPGEKQFVRFSISVPADAEPGGHYGSLLATITGAAGEITGSGVATKVGALVLLSVSGNVKEALLVEEFSAPGFQEKGPVPFTARFTNTGTIHVRPVGFVQVTNLFGRKVEEFMFPQKNVIPGAKRHLEFAWSPSGFTAGRYTASLVGNYGMSNIPVSAVTVFWVLPWKQLSVIGLAVLVVLAVFYKTRKRLALAVGVLVKGEKA